ncbi:hypothetical protein C8A05DRAFT_16645, partial [Staphylotrichum tortipilum]
NDTYAPTPIIPVAFAFRGADLAGYLQPRVTFAIYPCWNDSVNTGDFDMTWGNFTARDPYIQYGEALELLNTEGIWTLEWDLKTLQCSATGTDARNITSGYRKGRVTFTTRNGAKKPDLAATLPRETCSNSEGFAFDVTDTHDSGMAIKNGKPCAVLALTTPTPSACGIKIGAAAAAGVSTELTDRACAVQTPNPTPWCPTPETSTAGGLEVPSKGVGTMACLAAAVGGLGFLQLAMA